MRVWPLVLDLTVRPVEAKRVHVWLPLFLLWPLLLVLALIGLVLTVVADIVLVLVGRGYQGYTVLLWSLLAMLADTRGTQLRFNDAKAGVDMTFL
jgi:hypothetical protein